ncbi:protein-cysteine N-palmitoyltransferase HHAT-like protein isoform X3 [Phacochoerus africanus]|uniref:protein-cysteine N-palmitoyltransferase HHAT-like protein isoform X3 n=1 Tax=Phacochoerus africanus TaxID=41426 RepID=UPI001FDA45A1|nr:protein-cysteine N-palmitoyltransferase HHAT-like protein isoform X3 [Phacochoerus africanus]
MGIKTALPAAEVGLYSLVLSGALAYAGRGLLEASQAPLLDVCCVWGPGRGGHNGPVVPAAVAGPLCGPLYGLTLGPALALSWPRPGQPCLIQTGPSNLLAEVLFHGGSGFTVLRCTSFALESCAHPDRRYSLADLLKYNFYLPFFFFGPIMTFDRFHAQVSQVEPVRREGELWRIRAQAGLSVVAIVAVDIFFHFFYILTIPSDLKFANRLPDSALAGLAYSNLVYDWVKAAVLFGVVNTVARLDHLDPPQPPKCITALYVFAETHFDRGINDWLCKYVYDHIGGKHSSVIPELGATVATFAITTLWLGPCDIVYLWSCLNCFGLNFELWVQKLAEWGPLAHIEASLSEQMSRRVRAIFGAMNFWAIIMYNLVSLNSLEFTELVAQRLLLRGEGQGIQYVPGVSVEDSDLLKCPYCTTVPQGLIRENQSSGERTVTGLGGWRCSQTP